MSDLVVDASVGAKWVLPEPFDTEARGLLGVGHALLAPDLIYAEVGIVLWKRVRRGELTSEEASAAVSTFAAVPLRVFPALPLLASALQLALDTGRTVYDSLYLALAIGQGCPLITADQPLYNILRSGPFAAHVLWIADPL